MEPSEQCFDLIKCFEKFRATAYWCPGKVLTIGYGSTTGVTLFQTITHEEALRRLKREVAIFAEGVRHYISVPLTQNQFDALVSFAFNIGLGAFGKSTLVKKLNNWQYTEVPEEMQRWVYGGGKILGGLRERRKAEAALFSKLDSSIVN